MNRAETGATRAARIPALGLGLSVDVYSPDVFELTAAVTRVAPVSYLEVFKASISVLAEVRRCLPGMPFGFHGEGIWLTEPAAPARYPLDAEVRAAFDQAAALGSPWINVECATKQIAGYSFGTYLPPLFTAGAADVVAANAARVQARLDDLAGGSHAAPLLVLELPPLTYFGIGTLPVADFFRRIAEGASCGFVLDIGHLWTHYRYGRHGRSLDRYLTEFLDAFPLDRVIEIHLAGLAPHDSDTAEQSAGTPRWLDAHPAPIPAVLYDILDAVLAHGALTRLRGVALEVDGKAIALTVQEYDRFARRYGQRIGRLVGHARSIAAPYEGMAMSPVATEAVYADYDRYARLVSCGLDGTIGGAAENDAGIRQYRQHYLPYEILCWGGNVAEMFPETCRKLDAGGIQLADFVAFWFRAPRSAERPYDFFLEKIERFEAFVLERMPAAAATVRQESGALRDGYAEACAIRPVPEAVSV